jgi:FMN phosphatase YigB (HAD superfamily)
MDLGTDEILLSADLGFEKPSLGFFEKVAEAAGVQPAEVLYIGDRVDNDVLPAKAIGMKAVLMRRGPWGYLHAEWPQAAQADAIVNSLLEIPDLVK